MYSQQPTISMIHNCHLFALTIILFNIFLICAVVMVSALSIAFAIIIVSLTDFDFIQTLPFNPTAISKGIRFPISFKTKQFGSNNLTTCKSKLD